MGLLCSRSDTPFGGLRSQSLPKKDDKRKMTTRLGDHFFGAADGTSLLAIRHAFRRSSFAKPAAQNTDTAVFSPPLYAAVAASSPPEFHDQKTNNHPFGWFLFWCGRWDLNPYARAHAPQTCLSANSSTAAHHVIIAVGMVVVNCF